MRGRPGWWAFALLVGTLVLVPARAEAEPPLGATSVVPVPTVIGPITGGVRGQPWAGSLEAQAPLAPSGFVEEEYFVSGSAAGRDVQGRPTGSTAPFTTRLLVDRPADPARFNGTVVVEWINVTAQMDLPIIWGMNHAELLREGYAYVGVSVQVAGVSGGPLALRAWDPVRYAPLDHPGDAYMHDILSQAARSLFEHTGPDPLGGLVPRAVLAAGESQSCTLLGQYAAVVQPEHQLFDGFLFHTCATPVSDAVGVPSIVLLSEAEIDGFTAPGDGSGTEVPQQVVDIPGLGLLRLSAIGGAPPATDGDLYRVWEVAGGSHYDDQALDYLVPLLADNLAAPLDGAPLPFPRNGCTGAPFNRLGIERPTRAALHQLERWVTTGESAPSFPRVERNDDGTIRRDADGLALGGIQLPPMAVPVGVNVGDDCPFIGSYTAFPVEKIRAACPSREAFLAEVRRAIAANLAEGSLLVPEGERYLAEAEALDVWAGQPVSGAAAPSCGLRATATPSASAPVAEQAAGTSGPMLPATGRDGLAWPATAAVTTALALARLLQRTGVPHTTRTRRSGHTGP